ncbi:unnamed protein product [Agarophyton chilense]
MILFNRSLFLFLDLQFPAFVILFQSSEKTEQPSISKALELDVTQRSTSTSCQSIQKAMKEAFYSQVDLVRRGLPVRVAQSEYVYAANYYAAYSSYFTYYNVNNTCVWTNLWYGLFDYQNRALWALDYLKQMRRWNPEISFLNFTQYSALPALDDEQGAYVETFWHNVDHRLKSTPRGNYVYTDFVFPRNVEVLYDPGKDIACFEYNKFDLLTDNTYVPATTAFVALGMASIKLYRIGGSKTSITQMLQHFAGYSFNGVRCTRKEKELLKVPKRLVQAYSRNLGFIYASSSKATLPVFTVEAFESIFADEISSLTSYNSWGQTEYAKLVGRYSIPAIVNSVETLLDSQNYNSLISAPGGSGGTTNDYYFEVDDRFIVERQGSCSAGYFWLTRSITVTNALEHCCAAVCDTFALLSTSVDPFPHEECCYRCNENHGCPSGLQQEDVFDNDNTYVIVPEYGEQSQQTVTMIDI